MKDKPSLETLLGLAENVHTTFAELKASDALQVHNPGKVNREDKRYKALVTRYEALKLLRDTVKVSFNLKNDFFILRLRVKWYLYLYQQQTFRDYTYIRSIATTR